MIIDLPCECRLALHLTFTFLTSFASHSEPVVQKTESCKTMMLLSHLSQSTLTTLLLSLIILTTTSSDSSSDDQRKALGENKFQELQEKTVSSSCWKDAVARLNTTCKKITDVEQSRLAVEESLDFHCEMEVKQNQALDNQAAIIDYIYIRQTNSFLT